MASKAAEWASAEHKRQMALEAARAEIDAQLNSGDSPTVFMRDRSPLARVIQVDGHPRMNLQTYSNSNVWLTATEALALAEWITATFGDQEGA